MPNVETPATLSGESESEMLWGFGFFVYLIFVYPLFFRQYYTYRISGKTSAFEKEFAMEKFNTSIQCTVDQCRYHCSDCNYCSLDKVLIGTHESSPSTDHCTDCLSFDLK